MYNVVCNYGLNNQITDHTPVTDYLYTYSIKSNTFEVVRTKKEQVGAGPRFSHTGNQCSILSICI